ncbi:GNAT family N-acetyltransferase [Piscibacillus halophilus]|nr:GNAT family N-acetyltransferase [Piscibacillus halophilus]
MIRLANEKDAEELSRLNQEFNGGERQPTTRIIESFNNNNELVTVAFLKDKLVGFACGQIYRSFCYSVAQGEITELYIEDHARRHGIASSLIDEYHLVPFCVISTFLLRTS